MGCITWGKTKSCKAGTVILIVADEERCSAKRARLPRTFLGMVKFESIRMVKCPTFRAFFLTFALALTRRKTRKMIITR